MKANDVAKTGNGPWMDRDLRPEFISKVYGCDVLDVAVQSLDAATQVPAGSCWWWEYSTGPGGFVAQERTLR